MTRPVYGITVLRYEDGRTELVAPLGIDGRTFSPMPTDWRLRHAMLIDACEQVKREAGVHETGTPDTLDE